MKKAIALLLALIMLLSTVCAGVNAVDAELEQTDEKVETEDGRIVLTDDELKEKFGIEKILLPEGFEPFAYVYYDGEADGELPEHMTLCFADGTTADIKNDFENYVKVNDLTIKNYCYYSLLGKKLSMVINIKETDTQVLYFYFDYDCEHKKQPFSENLKKHIKNVSICINGLIEGEDPGFLEIIDFGDVDSLKSRLLRMRKKLFGGRDYFFDDFIFDINYLNMLFIYYCLDELLPNT